nr:hypothetical protein Iba_chr07cCG12730 [Ipomoea batatas]
MAMRIKPHSELPCILQSHHQPWHDKAWPTVESMVVLALGMVRNSGATSMECGKGCETWLGNAWARMWMGRLWSGKFTLSPPI